MQLFVGGMINYAMKSGYACCVRERRYLQGRSAKHYCDLMWNTQLPIRASEGFTGGSERSELVVMFLVLQEQAVQSKLHQISIGYKIFTDRGLHPPLEEKNGIYLIPVKQSQPDSGFANRFRKTLLAQNVFEFSRRKQSPAKGYVSESGPQAALPQERLNQRMMGYVPCVIKIFPETKASLWYISAEKLRMLRFPYSGFGPPGLRFGFAALARRLPCPGKRLAGRAFAFGNKIIQLFISVGDFYESVCNLTHVNWIAGGKTVGMCLERAPAKCGFDLAGVESPEKIGGDDKFSAEEGTACKDNRIVGYDSHIK